MEKKKKVLAVSVIAFLLLLGFGTYNAYTLLKPKTVVVETNKTVAKYSLYYEHSSIVSKGNPVWPVGEKLSNRDVYFFSINPVLNVTFNFDLPDSGFKIDCTTKLLIVSSDSERTYWQVERILNSESEVVTGKKFSRIFTVNVEELKREIREIEQSLGFRGGSKKVKLVTDVVAVGSVGGKSRKIGENAELEIRISESYYRVLSSPVNGEIAIPSKKVKTIPPGQKEYILASLWILIPCVGIAGSVVVYKYAPTRSVEREFRKFRKWISHGRMPDINMTEVEMKSLEDLVDAAIDANERVVYDESRNVYFFIHGNVLYLYKPKLSEL